MVFDYAPSLLRRQRLRRVRDFRFTAPPGAARCWSELFAEGERRLTGDRSSTGPSAALTATTLPLGGQRHFEGPVERLAGDTPKYWSLRYSRMGFYGDRRAYGPRLPIDARRPQAPRVADRDAGSGGEDRPGRRCRAAQHPLAGPEDLPRSCRRYLSRAGTSLDAVRDQRVDPLHQPDQDARIPGGGQAGGLDADRATWCTPTATRGLVAASPTTVELRASRSRRRSRASAAAGLAGRRLVGADVLEPDLGSHRRRSSATEARPPTPRSPVRGARDAPRRSGKAEPCSTI